MAKLSITLLSPKGPLYRHRGGIFKKSLRYGPLTLTTLAALIPSDLDAAVEIIDEGIEEIPLDMRTDLIGITVITGTATRSYELADHFRQQGISVVLGGPHVTLLPDEAALHADSIVTGYAEDSWPQLLHDFIAGCMQPHYAQNPTLSLANRPFAKRELLDAKKFLTLDVFEANRSCIHACEFCVAPTAWGRKPYQKPVADVIADIKQRKAKKLIFIDLNLISDKDYALELFAELARLKVSWFGLATMLIAFDDDLLNAAARSGCSGLLIGFESISKTNLRSTRKGFNAPDRYIEAVIRLHQHGISVMGCFVFGLDEDGPEVFLETARFVVEAHIDLPRFAIATPFPSTPLYQRLEAEGRILTKDWQWYDGQHVVFQPKGMSVKELEQGHEAAWRYAYRYRSIGKRLAGSRTQIPISIASNLGYRFYAHNLHRFYNCDWFIGQRGR